MPQKRQMMMDETQMWICRIFSLLVSMSFVFATIFLNHVIGIHTSKEVLAITFWSSLIFSYIACRDVELSKPK